MHIPSRTARANCAQRVKHSLNRRTRKTGFVLIIKILMLVINRFTRDEEFYKLAAASGDGGDHDSKFDRKMCFVKRHLQSWLSERFERQNAFLLPGARWLLYINSGSRFCD